MAGTAEITLLLDAALGGDRVALYSVLATLYQELHSMARRQLAGQYGQTLDATALVHEAYLKLIGRREAQFDDRAHCFAYAAAAMRSVAASTIWPCRAKEPRPSASAAAFAARTSSAQAISSVVAENTSFATGACAG